MNLPLIPFFVSPYKEESGGVDFLGLRQVNLNLIDSFLPGINNVTFYLRPYSVMCWIVWAFGKKVGEREVKTSEFIAFKEKVEILFNWSHQLNDSGRGMPGNGQEAPHKGEGNLTLQFSHWKRKVSWFDAVNYGPSAKIENGLGFIRQVKPGVFTVTKSGEMLALSINERLKTSSNYNLLFDLEHMTSTRSIVLELFKNWKVDEPSNAEAEIFCKLLYDPSLINQPSSIGRRSASIKLILSALNTMNKPTCSDELRRFIALRPYPFSQELESEDSLIKAQALWSVLQVRQLNRLAFETILGWVEVQILELGRAHSLNFVEKILNLIKEKYPKIELNNWIREQVISINCNKVENSNILISGIENVKLNIFEKMDQIIKEVNNKEKDEVVVIALETLILCSEITKELMLNPHAKNHVRVGGSSRISLEYWMTFVEENKLLPIHSFISKVIENLILSQHFGVAAARYSDGKQRLRFSIEEGGIVSMLAKTTDALKPSITRDRLDTVLSLMHDAGLLNKKLGNNNQFLYSINEPPQ